MPEGRTHCFIEVRGGPAELAAGAETLSGTAYYYPLATRSVYVTLDVRF